jgi:hypothetical protein
MRSRGHLVDLHVTRFRAVIFNPILLRLGGLLKGVLVCLEAAQSPVVGHLGYFSLARRPLSLLHGRIHLSEALRFVHDAPQRELVGRTQLAILYHPQLGSSTTTEGEVKALPCSAHLVHHGGLLVAPRRLHTAHTRFNRFASTPRNAPRLPIQTNNHTTSEPHTHVMSNENKFPLKRSSFVRRRLRSDFSRFDPASPEPLHVAAAGIWRRIEHLRCWGKAHAASGVRGRCHRPVGSALVRIDPPVAVQSLTACG